MNPRLKLVVAGLALLLAGGGVLAQPAGAHSPAPPAKKQAEPAAAAKDKDKEAPPKESLADQVRAILEKEKNAIPSAVRRRSHTPQPIPVITVDVNKRSAARGAPASASASAPAHVDPGNAPPLEPRLSQQYQRARAVALTGHVPAALVEPRMPVPVAATRAAGRAGAQPMGPWAYEGEAGPQAWDKLNPDFKLCAAGKRQSPIHIEGSSTLVGPAEPLQFNYQPSAGSVLNNGYTLQVDVEGENTLVVRGSTYKLVQFHFHHPAEEQVNQRSFAMVAHLLHRNAEGQLAMVAVLMDPGETSPLINKVWTYLPLEVADRVRVPAGVIDLNELLPKDQRYYQFMGSLTTPPCSENVLWMVMKTPVSLGADQLKLFSQLFPHNARPVQALNGRVVREAQ